VAQSVERLPSSAQVMIPGSWDRVLHGGPALGSLLVGESACPSPSAAPLACVPALSQIHKIFKTKTKTKTKQSTSQ